MKTEYQTHDLSLPAWGPYTKQYSGISHIPAANDGVRFDLAVFPGLYRRRVDVPNVRFESGYHVWKAAPDLSCYTLRHELEWKDRVYADVSFAPLGENARLIRVECCNGTDTPQNLVLHYMASAHDPVPSYRRFALTGAEVRLPEHAAFVLAKDYDDLRFAVSRPTDGLGWDGMRRAEEPVEGFAGGYGVGLGFGCAAGYGPFGQPLPSGAGDAVTYTFTLEQPLQRPCLCVRYINADSAASGYRLSSGDVLELPPAPQPEVARICLSRPLAAGAHILHPFVGEILCDQSHARVHERSAHAHIPEYSELAHQFVFFQSAVPCPERLATPLCAWIFECFVQSLVAFRACIAGAS